jgi:glyoxylase-like metal-dependent hydrolase (beta-lactamase superfamily II)
MTIDKSMVTYRLNFGVPFKQIVYIWFIEGPKEKILVDAGVSADYFITKRGLPARDIQSLDEGLRKIGLKKSDIDLVILTQLHHDHVAQASEFTKARFLIQKAELEFALNPHPTVAMQYPREFFENLNFEVIEGDESICDKVSVISTPGHTPGGQSVAVKTAKGTAIISGLCSTRENFEPPEPFNQTMSVFPYGVFVDLFKMYDNLLKIKRSADIVIPNHDQEYINGVKIP